MKHSYLTFCLALFLSFIATIASAHDFVVNGIYYVITSEEDLTVEVTFKGTSSSAYSDEYTGSITIPASVTYNGNNYSVTDIGEYAFYQCSLLTSINISEGVTSIGYRAFRQCIGLTSITIPESIKSIGTQAFDGTAWLDNQPDGLVYLGKFAYKYKGTMPDNTQIEIIEGTKGIACSTFSKSTGLTSINIPESVTIIEDYAFYGCTGLTSIIIPETVTSIGENAFYNCSSLTSVTALNTTPITITYNAFSNRTNATLYVPYGCKSAYETAAYWKEFKTIEEIGTFIDFGDDNVKAICVANWDTNGDGELSKEEAESVTDLASVFRYNKNIISFDELKYFTSLTSIGNYQFDDCSSLTSITIPEGVTSIGANAFQYCSGLTSITIPDGVTSIGANAFHGCSGLTSIIIPDGVTSIRDYAFYGCTGLTSITIPESVTSIGKSAFEQCSGLTSITIPEGVTSIGDYAFRECSGLTSITIPESVTSIGNNAFYNCSGLTSLTISEGVTSIGDYAFSECSGLTSITIPESVTSIGGGAFYGTPWYNNQPDGLVYAGKVAYKYKGTMPENTHIELAEGTKGIAGYAFQYCSGLTSITIPDGVTSVGDWAFSDCTSLTSITIPDGVTSVGDWAFFHCSSLTSVSIPEGVTSIGYSAFNGCSSLTSITIPEGVTSIGRYAFLGCSGLTSITIPESVTSIGHSTFSGCSGLTSVTIPSSVTSIENCAFYKCTSLTSVTALNTTPVTISSNTFSNRANATLYVPYGCKAAYEAADYWKEFKEIQELTITITVGSAGMATYCSPYDLDFTDSDAKAYIVSGFTPSTAQVILTRVYDVKAGTGIVVKAAEGSYEIPVRDAETILVNMLRGVTESTILNKVEGDYTNYILAKKNDVLGFYAVADGSTLGANKAYLPLLTSALPAAAEVKLMLVFDDEETVTGIEAPEEQVAAEGAIYNLNGQRLSRLQKGVNIVGGKKVFIK